MRDMPRCAPRLSSCYNCSAINVGVISRLFRQARGVARLVSPLIIVAATLSCSSTHDGRASSRFVQLGRQQNQARALAVGLNSFSKAHYGKHGKLQACENDARDMAAIAGSQGFETVTLLTKSATKAAFRKVVEKAAMELQEGDTLVISFSGHGANTDDTNGDEDDALDETLCFYDGQIVDDELMDLWSRFNKGVRILFFADSCHSGSVIKRHDPISGATIAFNERAKMSKAFTDQELLALRARPGNRAMDHGLPRDRESNAKTAATVVLISGCQDDQESMDGVENGEFTAELKRVWNGGRYRGSLPKLHETISGRMPAYQQPKYLVLGGDNKRFEMQPPWAR